MPLATKDNAIVLTNGRLAENCECCGCTQAKAFKTFQLILQSSVTVTLDTDINYGQNYTSGYDGLFSNSILASNLPDYNMTFVKQNTRSGTYTLSRNRFFTELAVNGDTNCFVEFSYAKAHLFLYVVFLVVTTAEKKYTYSDFPALDWPSTGCPVFCWSQMSSFVARSVAPASVYTGGPIQKTTTRLGLGGNSFVQSPYYLTSRNPHYLIGASSIDFGGGMYETTSVGLQSKELKANALWINGDLPESEYDARAVSLNTSNDALVLCPPPGVFDWLSERGGTTANRVTPYILERTPQRVVIGTPPATANYTRTAFVAPASGYSQFVQVMGGPRYTMTPPVNGLNGSMAWYDSRLIATAGYNELLATTQQLATTTAQISVTYR
jgi:hypothetical protein